ncbi:hypothetical protein ACOMHN_013826 [Nucella lapillus]
MDGFKSIWKRSGELARLSKRDEHLSVADTLLAEVDFHIQELEQVLSMRHREEQIMRTGVDYTWLVSEQQKVYRVPQLERLELEEICLKLAPTECSRVVTMFRESLLREPKLEDLARIMRSCVLQVLEGRPRAQSLSSSISEWVNRHTSMVSLKVKPAIRVGPSGSDDSDIEMQAENVGGQARAFSMPSFTVSTNEVAAVRLGGHTSGSHPV